MQLNLKYLTLNFFFFRFKTDFSNGDTGFRLEFESEGCSGQFVKPTGVIQTPNYPNPYPPNTQCLWKIEAPFGNLIEVTLHDFDFETMPTCSEDGIIVSCTAKFITWSQKKKRFIFLISFRMKKIRPMKLLRYAAVNIMLQIQSHRKQIFFLSNFIPICHTLDVALHLRIGRFHQVRLNIFLFQHIRYRNNHFFKECGGTFQTLTGVIQSPNFPNNYNPDSYCEYLIRTEPSHTLELRIKDFDIEYTSGCRDDYLQIFDGSKVDDDKVLLNRTCRPINNTIISNTNEMLVVFRSDSQIEAKGFIAEFETRCGSRINATHSGIIEVGHNIRWTVKECEWVITAPQLGN